VAASFSPVSVLSSTVEIEVDRILFDMDGVLIKSTFGTNDAGPGRRQGSALQTVLIFETRMVAVQCTTTEAYIPEHASFSVAFRRAARRLPPQPPR
jgi:hypothetical protein